MNVSHAWGAFVSVGVGGFAGAAARYGVTLLSQRVAGQWPLGTLAANVLGCLVVGLVAGLVGRGDSLSPSVRLFMATGFCGGFTTMSSAVYETAEMLRSGANMHAALYLVGTLTLSMCGFFLGVAFIRLVPDWGGAS
jgi:CrcB protein